MSEVLLGRQHLRVQKAFRVDCKAGLAQLLERLTVATRVLSVQLNREDLLQFVEVWAALRLFLQHAWKQLREMFKLFASCAAQSLDLNEIVLAVAHNFFIDGVAEEANSECHKSDGKDCCSSEVDFPVGCFGEIALRQQQHLRCLEGRSNSLQHVLALARVERQQLGL